MTRLLTYEGLGTEVTSFTVAGLSGLTVLGVLRAGVYKRVITTAPAADDEIKISGTDQGDGKGILSSGGTVYLRTGDGLLTGEKLDFIYYE